MKPEPGPEIGRGEIVLHAKRIKKSTYECRHLLPSGKFYYKIYQDKDGTFFSDPETYNCEDVDQLKALINKNPQIKMQGQEHFKRIQECQENLNKMQEHKK
jgi:hypothetical protein